MSLDERPETVPEGTLLDTGGRRPAGEPESTSVDGGGVESEATLLEAGTARGAGASDATLLEAGPRARGSPAVPETELDPGGTPRPARSPAPGPSRPGAIGAVATWGSALEPGKERFAFLERLRTECGRTVDRVLDRDLGREVELHRAGPGLPPEAVVEVGRVLARLRHPALPVSYGAGVDPAGEPFFVVSRPAGAPLADRLDRIDGGFLTLEPRRRLLGALAEVARGLHSARATVGAHRGISTRSIWIDDEGRVTLMGWGGRWREDQDAAAYAAPDLRAGKGNASPVADVYSLGMVACEIVLGEPVRPLGRRNRIPGGFPPELRSVLLRATDPRPARRDPDLAAFATRLQGAFRGELATDGPVPLRWRLRRFAARRPYLVLATVLGASALLAIAGQAAYASREARGEWEREFGTLIEPASEIEALADRLARAGEGEDRAIDEWVDRQERFAAIGNWDPHVDLSAVVEARREAVLDRLARGRAAYASLELHEHRFQERLRTVREVHGEAATTRAEELERRARLALARATLERAARELAFAVREERFGLSTQRLEMARRTRSVHAALAADAKAEDLERAVAGMVDGLVEAGLFDPAMAWGEAARLLSGLPRQAREDPALAARWQALADAFLDAGTVRIRSLPRGVAVHLTEVRYDREPFRLAPLESMEEPGERQLPMGYYVLVLEGAGREVRHPFLVGRGEVLELDPEWPDEFPPGDFVYVPASRYRAGGGGHGPFREERLEEGFFMARFELTRGEVAAFLRSRGQSLRDMGDPRLPLGIPPEVVEIYGAWLSARDGGKWRYRLPTEAEWELAARGAAGWVFPWGDRWLDDCCNAGAGPLPVGSFPKGASIYGLHDMAGNQREFAVRIPPSRELPWVYRGGCWGGAPGSVSSRQILEPQKAPDGTTIPLMADGIRLVATRAR